MLSYLHGFHAGNAADVFKHSVLVFCLEYLKKKEKPLLCVDTHAGAGFYDFSESAARPNREWKNGIGRLPGVSAPGPFFPGEEMSQAALPPMIASYLETVGAAGRRYAGKYPGSPAIMADLLKKGDRLVCFELHQREAETLEASMTELRNAEGPLIEVRREDGKNGVKSLLPPASRRGLIFVDPPWEDRDEYDSVPRAVQEGIRRFPEGTFIIWYPLLARSKEKAALPLAERLFALGEGKRCAAELCTAPPSAFDPQSPRGMYGSALTIFNPPWTLRSALEEALPYLAKTLGGAAGRWRLDWKE